MKTDESRDRPGHRTPPRPVSSRVNTFVAERSWGDLYNRTRVRTHAQSRAELESYRARVPYMGGCDSSPATVLRLGALKSKSKRSRPAYGNLGLRAERPHTWVNEDIPAAPSIGRPHESGMPLTVTFAANATTRLFANTTTRQPWKPPPTKRVTSIDREDAEPSTAAASADAMYPAGHVHVPQSSCNPAKRCYAYSIIPVRRVVSQGWWKIGELA